MSSQRFTQEQATPQGIGAGQTATLNFPLGPTYHAVFLRLNVDVAGTATNPAATDMHNYIESVKFRVDGNVTYECPISVLVKDNHFFGRTMRAGVMPIYFDLNYARTVMGEDLGAYGTGGGLTSFTMDLKIKDGVNVNSLKVFTEESFPAPGESNAFGWHQQLQVFSDHFGAVGQGEIDWVPREPYHLLGLSFDSSATDRIEILAGNQVIHVSDKELRDQIYYDSGRVKQAGMTYLDFVPKNRIALLRNTAGGAVIQPEALFMDLNSFRVKIDWTTAPNAFKGYVRSLKTADQV